MNKIRKASLLFIFFSTLLSFSQEQNYNVSKIPEELKKNANSIVRFENYSIEIKSQREMVINHEIAITIFNKLADNFANITVHYDNKRSVSGVKAYIFDANGEEIKKVKKSEFKDYSAFDGISLHNDGRLIHYEHTAITYPFTVYYKYEIKTSNTAFIPRWILNNSFFQSVEKADFTVKYPTSITLFRSEKNFDGFEVNKIEEPGFVSYKLNHISAIKKEPYIPELINMLPTVKFGISKFNLEGVDGEAANWSEFGKWYYDNLIETTLELPEATKQHINNLTKEVSNSVEKAKIVYNYVQNKVRYISVQLGIGGYKPMLASEVDKLGYGDCKGLTNYTSALLKVVGIPSYHTIIHADEKIDFDQNVASPEGNHMILYVPINNQDFWLECTSQKKPFGEIGDFTDDRDALVITPEGGIIKHTKIYKSEESLQLTKGSYSIDDTGKISAKISINALGTQYDNHLYRYDGESNRDLDLLFKKYFSNINNIEFSKMEVFNNKKESTYEEYVEFEAVNYGSFSGDQLLISINAFNKNLNVPKRIRNRKLPVQISSEFLDIDEVQINLPTSLKIEYIPENVVLITKFGMYSMEIEKMDDYTYLYKRKLQIEEGNYLKEDYAAYRDFRKKIRKYDNSKIVLIK